MSNDHTIPDLDITVSQFTGHAVAGTAIAISVLNYLPTLLGIIGSVLGIVWFLLQIYKDRTYQHWRNNRRTKRQARKLARLRAREKVTLAKIDAIEKIRHARREARELVEHERSEATKIVAEEPLETAERLPPI